MKFIVRLLLAVLVLVSSGRGARGAETNHNFGIWEKEISAYERADVTNPPPKDGIEFVGSSTIRLWKTLAQDYAGEPVFNRGFGGSEILDSTHFADRIIFPYAPRKIFFRAGGNDLANGKSAAEVYTNFQDFAALVHAKLPATEIYYIAWNPTPSRWRQHEAEKAMNGMIADFIKDRPWLKYIETSDLPFDAAGKLRPELFVADQLHFGPAGYQLLAARVRPYVSEPVPDGAVQGK